MLFPVEVFYNNYLNNSFDNFSGVENDWMDKKKVKKS